jgi:hypothetical protein
MTTHDYTDRYWGHYNTIQGAGERMVIIGWGKGIEEGDYLILPNGKGTTRYQVEDVEYFRDPPDMWRIEAAFAPRTEG